jgi:hypothetical protein
MQEIMGKFDVINNIAMAKQNIEGADFAPDLFPKKFTGDKNLQ